MFDKNISFWCVVLFFVVAMIIHHILSQKSIIEGNKNQDEDSGNIDMSNVKSFKFTIKGNSDAVVGMLGGKEKTLGTIGNPVVGGEATGGEATGGEATGGEATGDEATSGEATGGEATGGEATGGEATGGEATGGEATGGEATGDEATSGNPVVPTVSPQPTTPGMGEPMWVLAEETNKNCNEVCSSQEGNMRCLSGDWRMDLDEYKQALFEGGLKNEENVNTIEDVETWCGKISSSRGNTRPGTGNTPSRETQCFWTSNNNTDCESSHELSRRLCKCG